MQKSALCRSDTQAREGGSKLGVGWRVDFFLCVSEALQGRINLTEGPGATTRPWGPPGPHREEINLRPHRAASVITLEPKDKLTNRKASVVTE